DGKSSSILPFAMLSYNTVLACCQNMGRKSACTFPDHLAGRIIDNPAGIRSGFAAGALNKLERDFACVMIDSGLGYLAGLDHNIGGNHGVRIAIGADNVVDAAIEPDDDAGAKIAEKFLPVAGLILGVRKNFKFEEMLGSNRRMGQGCAQPQAASVDHK